MIEVDGLCKSVRSGSRDLEILDQLRLEVAAGESVAIVGNSGAGKSTLLGLLAGLDRPDRGRVSLAGVALESLDEDQCAALRARLLGFVFQNFQLLDGLTALENVSLPLELGGVRDAKVRAQEVLEQVGLAARGDHYPRQLSGGEQQRVAIARAFVARPQLLLADEPTGNLDEETGQRIIDLLFELNALHGTTLILVTHDEVLAERCSRRLRLLHGQLQPLPEAVR